MFTYTLVLVAVSLVLIVLHPFVGKRIPVETPVYYLSVGFSLLLSLILPYGLARLNVFALILIYLCLILAFAFGLTWAGEQYFLKRRGRVSADPENRYVGRKVGQLAMETPGASFAAVLADLVSREPDGAPDEERAAGESAGPPAPEDTVPAAAGGGQADREDPVAAPQPVAAPPEETLPPAAPAAVHRQEPEGQAPAETSPQEAPEAGREERERCVARLRDLFRALAQKPPLEVRARLTLEVSEAYRELGQYWQAVEIIRTFLAGSGPPADGGTLNELIVNAAYCQAIWTILRDQGSGLPPHAGLPAETRTAARTLAGKLILEGGWLGEEIA